MPSLPELPERPALPERARAAALTVGAAMGADSHVNLRLLLALLAALIGMSEAPKPHRQVGLAALLLIALDIARTTRRQGQRQ